MQLDTKPLIDAINRLIEKANMEKCEITISCKPGRTEITIQPWEPFHYSCPYSKGQNE